MRTSTQREERTMRLGKLAPALVAATSLLALAPAAASAHKHPSPLGRCRISIKSIAPRQITAGESTEISGRLACRRHANAGGQLVKLYAHVAGTAGYIPVQSTTTEANGSYEFTTAAETANTSFYVRSHGARSGHRRLRVAAQVTLTGPPEGTQIETGAPHQQTFSGTVNPADVGARVILQRENAVTGNEWHRIGIDQVMTGGIYSITHTFRVPGDASIRVLVRSDGLNIPSPSNELEYNISQAQNPSLTINSSADLISYGQPVTISGVLAGATTSQPVTLLARTVHQHGFAPIAEVGTGAGGSYSFPAQTPVNSTLYRVRGGGQKSAVLYEGVKDVLTAEVSATTIQAGQALTFKGTVAPDHTQRARDLPRASERRGHGLSRRAGRICPAGLDLLDRPPSLRAGNEGLPDRDSRRTGQRPRGQPAVRGQGDPGAGVRADARGAEQLVAAERRPDDGIGSRNTAQRITSER
jgi:hypothetical protein